MAERITARPKPKVIVRAKKGHVSFWTMADLLARKSEGERIKVIHEGMDSSWLQAVGTTFEMNRSSLARFVNLSETTLDRRLKAGTTLDQVASERLDRIAQVAMLAKSVFEAEQAAAKWMATDNDTLGGKAPLQMCDTELGARQVRRVLHAIEWGGVA